MLSEEQFYFHSAHLSLIDRTEKPIESKHVPWPSSTQKSHANFRLREGSINQCSKCDKLSLSRFVWLMIMTIMALKTACTLWRDFLIHLIIKLDYLNGKKLSKLDTKNSTFNWNKLTGTVEWFRWIWARFLCLLSTRRSKNEEEMENIGTQKRSFLPMNTLQFKYVLPFFLLIDDFPNRLILSKKTLCFFFSCVIHSAHASKNALGQKK